MNISRLSETLQAPTLGFPTSTSPNHPPKPKPHCRRSSPTSPMYSNGRLKRLLDLYHISQTRQASSKLLSKLKAMSTRQSPICCHHPHKAVTRLVALAPASSVTQTAILRWSKSLRRSKIGVKVDRNHLQNTTLLSEPKTPIWPLQTQINFLQP